MRPIEQECAVRVIQAHARTYLAKRRFYVHGTMNVSAIKLQACDLLPSPIASLCACI